MKRMNNFSTFGFYSASFALVAAFVLATTQALGQGGTWSQDAARHELKRCPLPKSVDVWNFIPPVGPSYHPGPYKGLLVQKVIMDCTSFGCYPHFDGSADHIVYFELFAVLTPQAGPSFRTVKDVVGLGYGGVVFELREFNEEFDAETKFIPFTLANHDLVANLVNVMSETPLSTGWASSDPDHWHNKKWIPIPGAPSEVWITDATGALVSCNGNGRSSGSAPSGPTLPVLTGPGGVSYTWDNDFGADPAVAGSGSLDVDPHRASLAYACCSPVIFDHDHSQ